MIKIVIASDVRLYSEGIRQFLPRHESFDVCAVAASAEDALRAMRTHDAHAVLLDQALPQAFDALRAILLEYPGCRVIALGLSDEETALLMWAEAGVAGLVPREASVDDLKRIIEGAMRGDLHCSARLAGALLRSVSARANGSVTWRVEPALTQRERVVAQLIDDGLSNKEIAQRLGIAVATVKNHIHNLLEKVSAKTRGEAAARIRLRDVRSSSRQEQ